MTCLVVAEHRAGQLRGATLELVTAARTSPPVTAAVIGPVPDAVVDALDVEGVDEILVVDAGDVDDLDPDVYRQAVARLLASQRPNLTLVASTAHGLAYAPAVAAAAGVGFAADVHGIRHDGETLIATRSFYGGKVHADVAFPGRQGTLLLLRQTVWQPAGGGPAGAERRRVPLELPPSRVRRIELVESRDTGVDITTADVILAVGRGIGERENLDLFEQLAEKLGATLAASRPLVDAGWISSDRQVGQSGKTVKPSVYLAFGISGASQHLAGMRSSDTIVAVNHDANAAIFSVADYGAVLDAVALARELLNVD
jgi:electron transfer flavoprotein alpha subunit